MAVMVEVVVPYSMSNSQGLNINKYFLTETDRERERMKRPG